MHADKIDAKKIEQSFLMNPQVLIWTFCFPWNLQKVTSSQTIKRYTQDQRLKMTQGTMKKVILILQWVNFCFQNTRQSKDCIFWMTCVGSLTKKLDFQKIFSKTDISLISFQQLDFE
jgi:hypothetical protein